VNGASGQRHTRDEQRAPHRAPSSMATMRPVEDRRSSRGSHSVVEFGCPSLHSAPEYPHVYTSPRFEIAALLSTPAATLTMKNCAAHQRATRATVNNHESTRRRIRTRATPTAVCLRSAGRHRLTLVFSRLGLGANASMRTGLRASASDPWPSRPLEPSPHANTCDAMRCDAMRCDATAVRQRGPHVGRSNKGDRRACSTRQRTGVRAKQRR
jgi:hypothetical protein